VREDDAQIEQRGTATDDQFAVEWIDDREAAGPIGTDHQLVIDHHEAPRLSVVTRWRQNGARNGKSCLFCGRSVARKVG